MPTSEGTGIFVDDPRADTRSPQERFIEEQIKFKKEIMSKSQSANVPTSITASTTVPWKVGTDYGCNAILNNTADFKILFRSFNKKDLALQQISFVEWFYDLKFNDKRLELAFPPSGGYAGTSDFVIDLYMTIFGDNFLNFDPLMIIPIGTLTYNDNAYGSPNNGAGGFLYESQTGEITNGRGKINILEGAIQYRNFNAPCYLGDWRDTDDYNKPDAITLEQINKWFISDDENIAYDTLNVSIASDISGLSVANQTFMTAMADVSNEYLEFRSTHSIIFRGNQGVYKVTRTV